MGDVRTCSRCHETKPLAEFYRATGGTGWRPYCKPCHKVKRREAYDNAGGKDASYERTLRREYGITLADYNSMATRQAHLCAACRQPETARSRGGGPRRLSVDYDRVAGTVRGLLCRRCSLLVWALEDNPATLDAVRAYVEEHQATKGDNR